MMTTIKGTINTRGQIKGNIKETFLKGDQGYSAYDVAVQNGFEGTEEEWLQSLVGEKGTSVIGATLNDDYTLTILLSDGSRHTTPSIRGARGNGISSVELNDDYTLSITFTDGEIYTTQSSIRGEKGDKGNDGISITDAQLNSDYTLTISFSDGSTYTTTPIRGQKGEKGDTGNGINNVVLNNDYTLTLTFDDGTTYTTPQIKGDKGDTGISITGAVLNQDYTLTVNFSDGSHYTTPSIRGQQGEKGDTGTGISSAVLNNNYTLTITLDDGTTYTTPPIRGEKGDAGFSPTASVNKSGNAATITITDQSGTSTATITDGAKGDDGFSPTVAVSEISEGHRVVITDKTGNHSFNVLDGESGVYIGDTEPSDPDVNVWIDTDDEADDVVTDVTVNGTSVVTDGVAEIPIASSDPGVVGIDSTLGIGIYNGKLLINGANSADIKSGSNTTKAVSAYRQHESAFYGLAKAAGDTTQKNSSNAVGTYTDEAKTAIKNMIGVEDPVVEDVQINGTSVINDGVANIPVASSGSLGVVRADNYYGVDVVPSGSDANLLRVRRAETSHIKAGTNAYKPIVPVNQHESVFYGLTKAAGVDMASSSNAVGTYTEEAKVAIQKMLGIYEAPWELIREDTFTNETEDDHFITVDSNGEPFELTDIAIMFETPTQQIDSAKGQYGQIWFYYANSNYYASESGAWTQAAGTPAHGFSAILEQKGRLMVLSFSNNTTSSNRGAVNFRYGAGMKSSSQSVQYLDEQRIFTKVAIPKVTGTGYYILCGKRKWN